MHAPYSLVLRDTTVSDTLLIQPDSI